LDMLQEVRTTALLQNVLNKPGAIDAHKYLELATIEGARALGLDQEIGSIEEGKKADLIIMNLENDFHCWHSEEVDPATRIVYASKNSDVETVIIDGKIVMSDKKLLMINKNDILENSKQEISKLLQRAKTILSAAG
ncbi:MAG TPA: N-ethylammeline chlorohydrolase, partial [Cyanobacteria bacterium UBA9579]|nr:N-ethylammeline chlorohydrolase [Cyanobacteria bacterium UBA9579]